LDPHKIPIPAKIFAEALQNEGIPFYSSYQPLYLQPLYQQKTVYGTNGCPFTCQYYSGNIDYSPGICPNAESLEFTVLSTEIVRPPLTFNDMDEIASGIKKILNNIDQFENFPPHSVDSS